MLSPHVAIAGGGPAGFLVGLLLAQCNIKITLLEQSPVADPWSSKSYSISLNQRGLAAVEAAGVLEQVQTAGTIRNKVLMELPGGMQKELPKDPPNYAITRPALVECLEQCLQAQAATHDGVTIQRGVAVTGVTNNEKGDDLLKVELDDGSTLECTHLVAADGKWSAVRNSMPEMESQFEVQEEPAFGVIMSPSVQSPKRWSTDATNLFFPNSPDPTYYCLAAPLPDGQYSVSAVCFDEIKEKHPWLVPPEDGSEGSHSSDNTWEAEYSVDTSAQAKESVQKSFAKMLQDELPLFYNDLTNNGDDTGALTFRINRRTSWLKPLVDHPQYTDSTGRVALIGDAAHAMTPSQGEGCNCALESAVSLTKPLLKDVEKGKAILAEDITAAFQAYGTTRASEVVPVQIKSAIANRYSERKPPPPPPSGPTKS